MQSQKSYKKSMLNALEYLGVLNQLIFHLHSVCEFRGLSRKASALFAIMVGEGAVYNYLRI
jgi:hypothetical protein